MLNVTWTFSALAYTSAAGGKKSVPDVISGHGIEYRQDKPRIAGFENAVQRYGCRHQATLQNPIDVNYFEEAYFRLEDFVHRQHIGARALVAVVDVIDGFLLERAGEHVILESASVGHGNVDRAACGRSP
jgi:hypothetical protein